MEAKFTAGKWDINVWDYALADPPRKELVIQNETNRIASLDWDQGKENPYTIPKEQAMANAALIAASPTMIEAIEFTLRLLDNLTTEEFSRGGDKPARDKLEAAYKLATGFDRNA